MGMFSVRMAVVSVLLAPFLTATQAAGATESPRGDLVLSELTVDTPPGTEDSWVELHNRGDETVSAGGTTIVCNGRAVFTFPRDVRLPALSFALVRFSRGEKTSQDREEGVSSPGCATFLAPCTDEVVVPGEGQRNKSPGYCALFRSRELNKTGLVDYVRWGRSSLRVVSETHRAWADELGLWPTDRDEGIYTGVYSGAGPLPPLEPVIVQRLVFSTDFDGPDGWCSGSLRTASPGRGNPWPCPEQIFPRWGGSMIDEESEYNIGLVWSGPCSLSSRAVRHRLGLPEGPLPDDLLMGRLQEATDPNFEEIVFDDRIPIGFHFEGRIKHGRYFGRLRWEVEQVSSDWSDTMYFSYEP